jgi:hypothetical protein
MKKITLLLLLSCVSASAQITYESADYATAGEEIIISKASPLGLFNFAETGANHNWDFSSLSAESQNTFSYQNPNNSGYKISWCFTHGYLFNCNSQFNNNFNLSALVTEGFDGEQFGITNVIEHSKLGATSLETKMVGMTMGFGALALPVATDYTTPDVIYQFPMNYGDTYTSTANFSVELPEISGFQVQYGAEITRTNTVEGWGSLVTPFMTFPNVLKVKTVVQREDTFTINGIGIPIPTTTVSYKWFDKNYGQPVLQADGMELFNFFIPTSISYIDGQQCLEPLAQFNLIPFGTDYNPETQSATVGFANLSANFDSVSWDFGDGGTSTDINPSHEFTCPGLHDVTLTVNNGFCDPAQTAAITLPIEITDSQNAFTTNVTVNDATLTADRNLTGTTYQWVDCNNGNTAIVGQTEQSYTADLSGSYACMLNTNGCESMTDCFTVEVLKNDTFDAQNSIVLYPNPTNGKLQLSNSRIAIQKVEIYNAIGILVAKELDLTNQSSGVYIVRITTADGTFVRKVVRE